MAVAEALAALDRVSARLDVVISGKAPKALVVKRGQGAGTTKLAAICRLYRRGGGGEQSTEVWPRRAWMGRGRDDGERRGADMTSVRRALRRIAAELVG